MIKLLTIFIYFKNKMIKTNDYFTFSDNASFSTQAESYLKEICDSSNEYILSLILTFVEFDDLLNLKRSSKFLHSSIGFVISKSISQSPKYIPVLPIVLNRFSLDILYGGSTITASTFVFSSISCCKTCDSFI